MGTHTAFPTQFELEVEAYNYARSTREALVYYERQILDSTFVYVYGTRRARLRIESIELAGQRLKVGLTTNVDLEVAGAAYERVRVTDLDTGSQQSSAQSFPVISGLLKVRTNGNDTTAWSRAIGLSVAHARGITLFGIGAAQVFPLGGSNSGRVALEIDGTTRESIPLSVDAALTHRWFLQLSSLAEYSAAWDLAQSGSEFGLVSTGVAIALGPRVMFDAGIRLGITDQAADRQFFFGVSGR